MFNLSDGETSQCRQGRQLFVVRRLVILCLCHPTPAVQHWHGCENTQGRNAWLVLHSSVGRASLKPAQQLLTGLHVQLRMAVCHALPTKVERHLKMSKPEPKPCFSVQMHTSPNTNP